MADASCILTLDAAKKDEAMRRFKFDKRLDAAIGDLIGFPSDEAMVNAEDSYRYEQSLPSHKRTKKLKQLKKKWLAEQKKFNEHNLLYDRIRDYTINSASEVGFDEKIVNVTEIMNDWQNIFAEHLQGHINPVTIQQGPRTIKSITGLVNRIIGKREHLKKIKKIPTYMLFAAPPGTVASWADEYGIINKVIKKVKLLSDAGVSDSQEFSVPMSAIHEKLGKLVESLASANISDFTTEKAFNLNNSVMEGTYTDSNGNIRYRGLSGVSTKKEHTALTILREETRHGREGYIAVEEDADFQVENWYDKDSINQSDTDIKDLLVSKYVNEVLYELGSGQMRKVVPKLMDNSNPDWVKDKKKIKGKLAQMVHYREKKDGNWRVPGIHTSKFTDANNTVWEYRWIMIKQGEESRGEQYNAYLLDKQRYEAGKRVFEQDSDQVNFVGNNIMKVFKEIQDDEGVTRQIEVESSEGIDYEIGEILNALDMPNPDGSFMRTEQYNDFGPHEGRVRGKKEKVDIQGSSKKQFINFQIMENPPNETVMNEDGGIWSSLLKQRSLLKRMFTEMSARTKKMTENRTRWDSLVRRQLKEMGMDDNAVEEYFQKMYNIGGLESNLVRDEKTGDLSMPHMFMKKKSENYMPSLYTTNSIIFEQIPSQIERITQKIKEFESAGEDESVQVYKEGLSHLKGLLSQMSQDDEFDNRMYDVNRVHHLKHITAWTDPTKVRKDDFVMNDYFQHTYNTINRNELIIELLKGVHKMNMISSIADYGNGHVSGSLEYMVNRVKIGLGDTSSRAITMFGNETSYDLMAEKLNNSMLGKATGIEWDGDAAERLTKWMTAPMTMYHLGSGGAFVNQTQVINDFIKNGWELTSKADALLKNDKEWEKVIEKTGVLNQLSIFQDIMLRGGKEKATDAGILNIAGIPIPTRNIERFVKLLNMGRKGFIDNVHNFKDVDRFLAELELRHGRGQGTSEIGELREANKLRSGIYKEKAGAMYDLFTMDENQSEALIKKRFRQLVGNVADSELKRMVSWKLTWWLPGGSDVFTFTGTEERLRKRSVISALLFAQAQGLLGQGNYSKDSNISPFLTDRAIQIARDAVYANQFGMTPPHIGEGFNGFGRNVFQYKQYPTLQIIHDYNIWKNFTDGNYSRADGVNRIVNAVIESGKLGKEYDPASLQADHQALAMARLLSTRVFASMVASFLSMIPFMGYAMRNFGIESYSLLRGAENPAFGLAMRTVMWAAFAQSGGDDGEEVLRGLGIFLLPVFLGTMLRAGEATVGWMD